MTEYEDRIVVKASMEKKKEICLPSGSEKLYHHGKGKTREVLHTWSRGKVDKSFDFWCERLNTFLKKKTSKVGD